MTDPIRAEWNRHQSGFARSWRGSMMARRKLVVVSDDQLRSLEERVARSTADVPLRAIMLKDRHLLEAALAADERVLSNDDRVRHQLREHIESLHELKAIHWVNPCTPDEAAVAWLEQGAPNDRSRQLGR
jgi:hypothetical protein